MESIISRLVTSKISIFHLVSVAEQAGLNLTLSETLKTGFLPSQPIYTVAMRKKVVSTPSKCFGGLRCNSCNCIFFLFYIVALYKHNKMLFVFLF